MLSDAKNTVSNELFANNEQFLLLTQYFLFNLLVLQQFVEIPYFFYIVVLKLSAAYLLYVGREVTYTLNRLLKRISLIHGYDKLLKIQEIALHACRSGILGKH